MIRRLARTAQSVPLAPLLLAVLLAGIYLATTPHTADLAAQQARAELYSRAGEVPYWTGWYSGISTVSYSLASPALLGWLGAAGLGAVSLLATALAAVAATSRSARPILGASVLVLLAGLDVFSGRSTFAMGTAFGIAAVAAMLHGRSGLAFLAAVIATAASPVAGVLLVVVAIGCLFSSDLRGRAITVIVAVVVVMVVIALYSHDQSTFQPFTLTSLVIAGLTAAVAIVAPVPRDVRIVAAVEIAAMIVAYEVHSPVGSNVTRLAILMTAPVVVATARGSWKLVVPFALAASILPAAQLVNDMSAASHGDGSRSFVASVRHQLAKDPGVRDHRVELVDTATHWPSTYLLPVVTLARGWERQIDESENPEFYGRGKLTAASYRRFLNTAAVSRVVVPRGMPYDSATKAEAALIARGLPYLFPIWHDADWVEYAVRNPTPMVSRGGLVVRQTNTGLVLFLSRPGRYTLALRWSPTLTVNRGSVSESPHGLVRVRVRKRGRYVVQGVWKWPWHL